MPGWQRPHSLSVSSSLVSFGFAPILCLEHPLPTSLPHTCPLRPADYCILKGLEGQESRAGEAEKQKVTEGWSVCCSASCAC